MTVELFDYPVFCNVVRWWAGQDLNLRPQPRKGCVLTELDYRPYVQDIGCRGFIKKLVSCFDRYFF